MSVDKISWPKGYLDFSWPQLPAKPAKEVPLDEYVPAPQWQGRLGIDVISKAKRPRPAVKTKNRIRISFRLLGQRYRWTINTRTSQVLDQDGKVVGTAHVRHLYPNKRGKLRFFDVSLAGKKREVFGYIARNGSVPFACLTRHTPQAEKVKLSRIMHGKWEYEDYEYARNGARKYTDDVLWRLDDVDMVNSFIEHLLPYLNRVSYDSSWAAEKLISILECSRLSDDKRDVIARRLLPLAEGNELVRGDFARAMGYGRSRKFLDTMKRLLLPRLGGNKGQNRANSP